MDIKKILKILPVVAASVAVVNIKAYATTEEMIANEANLDIVAPVFDTDIQTRYVVKKLDDGSEFIPQNVITGITAIDDVDGSDVAISIVENNVDLSLSGEYQVVYSATDKSGNTSYYMVTVIVDGIAPSFDENTESLYYVNSSGIILDSNYNVVESLPKALKATDSVGAYKGIGVYITTDMEGNIVFIDTIENSPAVGVIEPNDILVGVNGKDVRGQTPTEVSKVIKGEAGTGVQLEILRNGTPMTLTLERQVVNMYEEIEYTAEPVIEIESIDFKHSGVIEITYKATDAVGNSSEFVVKVVVDTTAPVLYIDGKSASEEEESYNVITTSDPPVDDELPVVTATDYDFLAEADVELEANAITVEKNFDENEKLSSVTYTATDKVGNTSSYTAYVKSEEDTETVLEEISKDIEKADTEVVEEKVESESQEEVKEEDIEEVTGNVEETVEAVAEVEEVTEETVAEEVENQVSEETDAVEVDTTENETPETVENVED